MTRLDAPSAPGLDLGDELELWLMGRTIIETSEVVYWAANSRVPPAQWVEARSVEQLAVLLSTASRSNNNACQVYGARSKSGRSVSIIGLQPSRGAWAGWAIVVAGDEISANIHHPDYPHDNYEGFSSVDAADICWSWVAKGHIPSGLVGRVRDRS